MKALFIGAHTDEELCFAGAIQHFNNRCFYTAFSSCSSEQLKNEFNASCDILDVNSISFDMVVRKFDQQDKRQVISDYLYEEQKVYDCLFTHSVNDVHPDHKVIAEESIRVWRKSLFTYVGPWNANEDSNYFIELTEEQLERKIQALACYKSQAHRPYMDPDFIRSWARYNGIKCGKLYAEGFKVVRLVQ